MNETSSRMCVEITTILLSERFFTSCRTWCFWFGSRPSVGSSSRSSSGSWRIAWASATRRLKPLDRVSMMLLRSSRSSMQSMALSMRRRFPSAVVADGRDEGESPRPSFLRSWERSPAGSRSASAPGAPCPACRSRRCVRCRRSARGSRKASSGWSTCPLRLGRGDRRSLPGRCGSSSRLPPSGRKSVCSVCLCRSWFHWKLSRLLLCVGDRMSAVDYRELLAGFPVGSFEISYLYCWETSYELSLKDGSYRDFQGSPGAGAAPWFRCGNAAMSRSLVPMLGTRRFPCGVSRGKAVAVSIDGKRNSPAAWIFRTSRPMQVGGRPDFRQYRLFLAFQQRKVNLESGALANLALAADPAAVPVDHRLDHGQPQAQAGAALGGSEALVLAEQAR